MASDTFDFRRLIVEHHYRPSYATAWTDLTVQNPGGLPRTSVSFFEMFLLLHQYLTASRYGKQNGRHSNGQHTHCAMLWPTVHPHGGILPKHPRQHERIRGSHHIRTRGAIRKLLVRTLTAYVPPLALALPT